MPNNLGLSRKGKWLIAGEDQERVKIVRGKMEGRIGTLKTEKYGFNKPKDRNWEVLQRSGQESILSLNLNKLMERFGKFQEGKESSICIEKKERQWDDCRGRLGEIEIVR